MAKSNLIPLTSGISGYKPAQSIAQSETSLASIEPFASAEIAADFACLSRRQLIDLAREDLVRGYPVGRKRKRWRFRLSEVAEDIAALKLKSGQQPL